jgi:hypothetical protein
LPTIESWVIWYDDGTTVEGSTLAAWQAAPTFAVIFVLVLLSNGTSRQLTGHDLIWMQDFGLGIVAADSNDRDGILRRLPWVKFGQWTTDAKFEQVQQAAAELAAKWDTKKTGRVQAPVEECTGCQ